jgi:hypothetical protein
VIWLLVMVVVVPPVRGAILFCYGLAFTGAFVYAASPAVRALSVHFETRGPELQVVER